MDRFLTGVGQLLGFAGVSLPDQSGDAAVAGQPADVEDGVARVTGEAERRCPLADLRVSEASRHGARIVTFPDGAFLEIDDKAAFASLLASTGHRGTLVARMQQSWRATLLAAAGMAVALLLLWRFALPLLADAVAAAASRFVRAVRSSSAIVSASWRASAVADTSYGFTVIASAPSSSTHNRANEVLHDRVNAS